MHQSPKVLATTMDLNTQNFHFYVKKPFVKSARTLFEPKQAKKWHLVRSSRGGGTTVPFESTTAAVYLGND